jgi:hypothetical protein
MAVIWELTPASYGWIVASFFAFRAFAAYTTTLITLLKLLARAFG